MDIKKLNSKQDFRRLLEALVEPLKPFLEDGGADVRLGNTSAHYPDSVAGLEAFARPLWGLAPYWAGGGEKEELAALYRRGLALGTDAGSTAYWDRDGEANQRYVEMAAIALGLLLAPEKLWAPLPEDTKHSLAAWLNKINTVDVDAYPDCNWWFFIVLANLALKARGQHCNQALMEHALGRIEAFYTGGGWYTDGPGGRKDYYVSFAIHFYSLVYAVLAGKDDPARAAKFKARAEEFAADFLYWFDDDGRAVPYGRSLTYRFAQGAFWAAYIYAGLSAVPLAVAKGVLARHLQQWMAQPVFDGNGLLTIGYAYPNLHMAESYNAPGSPYWALKPFLLLALPDGHPFWATEAAPMPPLAALRHLPKAEMLLQRCSGQVTMYPCGVFNEDDWGHLAEKYGKFAYSTGCGFSVAISMGHLAAAAPDNMLAFGINGYIYTRRSAKYTEVRGDQIFTIWSPIEGIVVESTITPTSHGHTRTHCISNSLAPCTVYDCGYAIEAKAPDQLRTACKGSKCVTENGYTQTMAQGLAQSPRGKGIAITPLPNTNLLYTKTSIAAVTYTIPQGKTTIETEFAFSLLENA